MQAKGLEHYFRQTLKMQAKGLEMNITPVNHMRQMEMTVHNYRH